MTAAFFTFTVQDVAERSDVVTASKIGFADIALDEIETIGHAELLRGLLGCGNHSGPIYRRHLHLG